MFTKIWGEDTKTPDNKFIFCETFYYFFRKTKQIK